MASRVFQCQKMLWYLVTAKKLPQCAGGPCRKQPRRKKSLIFHLKANGCFMVMTRTREKDWIRKKNRLGHCSKSVTSQKKIAANRRWAQARDNRNNLCSWNLHFRRVVHGIMDSWLELWRPTHNFWWASISIFFTVPRPSLFPLKHVYNGRRHTYLKEERLLYPKKSS